MRQTHIMMHKAHSRFGGLIWLPLTAFITLVTLTLSLSAQEYEGKTLVIPEMAVDSTHAEPGSTFLAGVEFEIQPDWHIYWKYSGDSGMPTRVEWEAPEGVEITELSWPLPYHIEEAGGIEVYGYGDEVMLLFRVRVPENFEGETLDLTAKASWLVCKEICVPGSATLTKSVPVAEPGTAEPQHSEKFLHWQEKQPQRAGALGLPFENFEWSKTDDSLVLTLTGLESERFAEGIDYFPLPDKGISIGHPEVRMIDEGATATVTIPVLDGLDTHDKIRGILVAEPESAGVRQGWFVERLQGTQFGSLTDAQREEIEALQAGGTPAGGDGAATNPDAAAGGTTAPGGDQNAGAEKTAAEQAGVVEVQNNGAAVPPLLHLIFFAFLGGLILNVMPCVLPAISLKIFGFIEQAQEDPRRIFLHGLSFTAGILLFFLGIGALAIAITAGGGLYTWGSQFQNPAFVIFLMIVVFVFALNLFGIFEISLPGAVQTGASQAAGGSGYAGSFLHGLLATLLATACTAPFMGVALTGTLGQPAYVILTVFGALGLGMASPYLLLSANPKWLKVMPKPGSWMEAVKQFMGFLLMATVIWLFSVLIRLTTIEAAIWTLVCLLGLGLALWLWGIVRPQFQGAASGVFGAMAAVVLLASLSVLYVKEVTTTEPVAAESSGGAANVQEIAKAASVTADGGIDWQKWSPEAVEAGLAQGRIVFVDFTAEWCVTCKTNKRLVLNTSPIQEAFAEHNVLALKADWTRPDEKIETALHSFDRIGIPVNIFYSPKNPGEPVILPEVLTKAVVLDTLQSVSQGDTGNLASS